MAEDIFTLERPFKRPIKRKKSDKSRKKFSCKILGKWFKKENFLMDVFSLKLNKKKKKRNVEKRKYFCKQFVRIKRNLLTTEPTKYGFNFSVSV